jgi:hypothetical protein
MRIEVQFESIEEMVGFADQLTQGLNPLTSTKKETKFTKVETIPSESETSMNNEPAGVELPKDETPDPEYTLEQVRAKLTELSRAGKQKEVKGILDFFKAKNVTTLDPKDYAAVMEKAGAL